ncbi:hypothetical protein WN943_017234 [Citrus x changshan-huyou]
MTISVTIVLWLPSNDLFPLLPLALVLDNSERCLYDYCNIVVASLGVLDFFMDHDQQSCVGIYNHWRPFKLVAPTGLVSWKTHHMGDLCPVRYRSDRPMKAFVCDLFGHE